MTVKQEHNLLTTPETANVELKVITNFIRKDLDIFNWLNRSYKQYGDFQIYSDNKLELNCFDQSLSLLIGRDIQYGEDTVEAYSTDKCIEYLFTNFMDKEINIADIEKMALKFTSYLVEVSYVCLYMEEVRNKRFMDILFKKYFPESVPTVWDSIRQKYSSNVA